MSKNWKSGTKALNYGSIPQAEVPQGRNGKHHNTIARIISDLEQLEPGRALKLELAKLPESKENVRSALNRKTRSMGIRVSTASDDNFFYIWHTEQSKD